jgi:hypothetical protein
MNRGNQLRPILLITIILSTCLATLFYKFQDTQARAAASSYINQPIIKPTSPETTAIISTPTTVNQTQTVIQASDPSTNGTEYGFNTPISCANSQTAKLTSGGVLLWMGNGQPPLPYSTSSNPWGNAPDGFALNALYQNVSESPNENPIGYTYARVHYNYFSCFWGICIDHTDYIDPLVVNPSLYEINCRVYEPQVQWQ